MKSLRDIRSELELKANEFLQEAYGLHLEVPLIINSRLKSTYGRFVYNGTHRTPLRIEISKNYIDHQEWGTVLETLVHECIHYALFMQNLPHRDGHPVFEAELKKWGSHSTGTVKYKGKVVQYGCPCCKKVFNRKRRLSKNRIYRGNCCGEIIEFLGEKIV